MTHARFPAHDLIKRFKNAPDSKFAEEELVILWSAAERDISAASSSRLSFQAGKFAGGWLHLILNMWTLWLFGPAIEDRLGHGRYLLFYLAVRHRGLVGACAVQPDLDCTRRWAPPERSPAFSDAIVRLFPSRAGRSCSSRSCSSRFFFEVPAFVFAGLWFLIQLLQGTVDLLHAVDADGVAWWAHIGGFVAGLCSARCWCRSERTLPRLLRRTKACSDSYRWEWPMRSDATRRPPCRSAISSGSSS